MPNGFYWYHSHRHTLTTQQTYAGLAGLLEIGCPDGNLPAVTADDVPVRDMALQYNFVFDRRAAAMSSTTRSGRSSSAPDPRRPATSSRTAAIGPASPR